MSIATIDQRKAGAAARATGADPHGRTADRPTEVPRRGWKDIFSRVRLESKRDNVTLLSAGVAFYSLLAMVPAMIAGISIYGLVSDPADVERQVVESLRAAPDEVRQLISTQLSSIAENSGGAALVATIIGIAVALWSASSGLEKLMTAINVAYDEEETRGFVKRKLMALGFTLGAIVFLSVAFTVIALLPPILADTGLGATGRIIAGSVRWVVLLGGMMLALAVVYRYAPDRDDARWRWVTPGAVVAALLWIISSVGFSIYTANFGKYNETYGTLAAVVVVMLWLFLTVLAVIVGAELNAELERQTLRDTTEGRPRPLGRRGAYAADTVGETAEEVAAEKESGASQGGGKEPEPEPGDKEKLPADLGGGTVWDRPAVRTPRPRGPGRPGAVPAALGLTALGAGLSALKSLLDRRR